jgi:hypothetical protein
VSTSSLVAFQRCAWVLVVVLQPFRREPIVRAQEIPNQNT